MLRRFALEGFVVIAPMLRGSDGTTGKDEMGGSDVHDLMNVFPLLSHLEYADPGQAFLYGESRGGVMTLLALREGAPVKADAVFGAITDMAAYVNSAPQAAKMAPQIWPDFNQHKEEILKERSAQRWPEKIKAPILLMHGAADPQVPPIQTLQLAEELAKQGSNYGVIIYPGDNHILSRHRDDRDREVVAWFKSFLDHTTSSGQ
jgi:dipeptidyl aminopeptidase/acylaminoacyl peptidase